MHLIPLRNAGGREAVSKATHWHPCMRGRVCVCACHPPACKCEFAGATSLGMHTDTVCAMAAPDPASSSSGWTRGVQVFLLLLLLPAPAPGEGVCPSPRYGCGDPTEKPQLQRLSCSPLGSFLPKSQSLALCNRSWTSSGLDLGFPRWVPCEARWGEESRGWWDLGSVPTSLAVPGAEPSPRGWINAAMQAAASSSLSWEPPKKTAVPVWGQA